MQIHDKGTKEGPRSELTSQQLACCLGPHEIKLISEVMKSGGSLLKQTRFPDDISLVTFSDILKASRERPTMDQSSSLKHSELCPKRQSTVVTASFCSHNLSNIKISNLESCSRDQVSPITLKKPCLMLEITWILLISWLKSLCQRPLCRGSGLGLGEFKDVLKDTRLLFPGVSKRPPSFHYQRHHLHPASTTTTLSRRHPPS